MQIITAALLLHHGFWIVDLNGRTVPKDYGLAFNSNTDTFVHRHILYSLPLLLLSRFSRVQLCATPQTAAHQAPPSLGFSRQEHWSGLPLPSPMHERKSESEVAELYLTLRDPMDCSLPGSSVHGIFQARVLEWGAIAFSVTNFIDELL